MLDIEINAWSSFFLNLETNLILYLYPEKCIKFNQLESRFRSREIWNFARHFKITIIYGKDSLTLKNRFLIFLYYYPKKSGLSKQLKVSTLDIRIKQSGLKVSSSKVSSSGVSTFIELKQTNTQTNKSIYHKY